MDIKYEKLKITVFTNNRHIFEQNLWNVDIIFNDDFARIYYLFSGEAYLTIRERKWRFAPGAIYLIPSGEDFMVHHSPHADIVSVHFTAVIDSVFDLFGMIKAPIEVLVHDLGFVDKMIKDILDIKEYDLGLNPLKLDSYIKMLLVPFLEKAEIKSDDFSNYDPDLKKLLGYMSSHCEQDLRVDELARSMHFHKNYFPSYFKKMTGKTPKQYLIDERIKRAKLLLLENRSSIREISDRLGFNDTCYFTRVFKQKTGMTPGAYAMQKVI